MHSGTNLLCHSQTEFSSPDEQRFKNVVKEAIAEHGDAQEHLPAKIPIFEERSKSMCAGGGEPQAPPPSRSASKAGASSQLDSDEHTGRNLLYQQVFRLDNFLPSVLSRTEGTTATKMASLSLACRETNSIFPAF